MSSQHYLADEDLFTSLSETRRRIKQEDSLTLQQKASMSFDHCGVVEPRSTRRKDCASFLQSPALREYCQERKCMTLSQIHKSFVNMDRFRAVLTKQRAFRYPKGRDIAGIQHELHRDPTLQSYIREVYDNEYGLFVFCALEAQIRYLASLDSFEVDMSYKRVKGDVIEVIFATLIQEHGKNQESPNAYEFIFSRVFYLIQKITNESVSGSTSRE
ncbi:hypothetical protein N7532_001998 [Penicillium argentinense]|uniref:Uncharacterized protein n=1 Tax=Penicillium argentinense TaxID=1131581 RepID=A0A9W9KMY8_9EURO|nr:uncharacterized protein N7532_001998 [Penicillium argentinense]KAJ5111463.1 hypothetical protein N7532_001998 [Penicillium argentinense]